MAEPANSVAVAAGSLVVTGTLTSFVAAQNDLFVAGGAVGLIASRESTTHLTLAQPWRGPSLSGEVAWGILSLGEYWRSAITISQKMQALVSLWEGTGLLHWNASGTLAERDGYNNQPAGFIYLATSPLPWRLYVKQANTNSAADWSPGQAIGETGQAVWDDALTQERNERSAADAGLDARLDVLESGAGSIAGIRVDLDAEVARATAKDSTHDSLLTGLRTDLTAETTTRAASDSTLDGRITTEVAARAAGDATLDAKITTEASTRSTADVALGARIDIETSARTSADAALGGRIDTEISDRAAADAVVKKAADLLTESTAQAFDAVDADIADTAAALQVDTAERDDDHAAGLLREIVLDHIRPPALQYAYLGQQDGSADITKVVALPHARRVLTIYPIMGQSLAEASTSGPTLWNAISLPYPHRALMPDTALHPDYAATAMVPLVEQQSPNRPYESMASGFANHLLRDIDAILPGTDCQIGVFITALGGRNYSALKRGSPTWLRYLATLEGLVRWALSQGYDEVVVPGILWVQGEAEGLGPGRDRYRAMLWQLQRDLQADTQRVTGQREPVMLFLSQTNEVESYSYPQSGVRVQEEQLQAAAWHPYVRLVGPIYQFPQSADKVHKTGTGANYMGQMFARAVLAEIYGAGWRPLEILDAYVTPGAGGALNRILLPCHVPVEPLVLDVSGTTISLTGMGSTLGFNAYAPDATAVTISSVSVAQASTDNNYRPTIQIDFAAAFTVPWIRLNYACNRDPSASYDDGPILGARGCVRDSARHLNLYNGSSHHNWLPQSSRRVVCNPAPAGTFG
ncbi:sialate O-acetylesterase [Methylobacterium sp. WSM2598]|uniref:sialate O-acetylesterase n=1 Tax=Methylobacterium sp. WSM2598 TaxID=398261 RepID=UPI000367FF06|nr:sialate O-acetylesterase [Methylobacterium sp. WSM2598]